MKNIKRCTIRGLLHPLWSHGPTIISICALALFIKPVIAAQQCTWTSQPVDGGAPAYSTVSAVDACTKAMENFRTLTQETWDIENTSKNNMHLYLIGQPEIIPEYYPYECRGNFEFHNHKTVRYSETWVEEIDGRIQN